MKTYNSIITEELLDKFRTAAIGKELPSLDLSHCKEATIPCVTIHNLADGYLFDLERIEEKKSVYVYVLERNDMDSFKIGYQIEYGRNKSKYKYSISGSTLYLPTGLDENTKVLIKYNKIINNQDINNEDLYLFK